MAAGVTLNSLEEFVSADKLIRIMPNTPVAIGQGMTTYSVVNPRTRSAIGTNFRKNWQGTASAREVDRCCGDGYRGLWTCLRLSDD